MEELELHISQILFIDNISHKTLYMFEYTFVTESKINLISRYALRNS